MKLLWLTDLHLEGPSMSVRESMYKSMERQRPEAVVITGDISVWSSRVRIGKFGQPVSRCRNQLCPGGS